MIVYKTTCLITGKSYIGKYEGNNPNYLGSGIIINRAIKKYGKENFERVILESCHSRQKLCEREKYWIKELSTLVPNGYNITSGGEGGNGLKHHPDREAIIKRLSLSKMGEKNPMYGIPHTEDFKRDRSEAWLGSRNPNFGKPLSEKTKKKLSKLLSGKNHPRYGKFGKDNPTSKPVLQFSKDGHFIKEWESISQASNELSIHRGNIGEVCKGQRKVAGIFTWKFKEKI